MTKIEKILMAVLLLAIIGTVVFWEDVSGLLTGNKEVTADDEKGEKKEKDKKKKDKKDKDKDEKDEVRLELRANTALYRA